MANNMQTYENEIWKDIPGYEGYYQASNNGRIRSLPRKIRQMKSKTYYVRNFKGKILRSRLQNSNYHVVWLSKEGKISVQLIHRLVAQTFMPNIGNKPCINHKNGNKSDNRADNLEWCDYSYNIKHSHRIMGRKKTTKPIICVELNREYKSQTEASEELGIKRACISHALNGRSKTAGGYAWRFI